MRRKNILLIIIVFVVGLAISSASFAFWSWTSNTNKNIVFNTASNLRNYIIFDEGNSSFVGEFNVSNTYTGGLHSTIGISKTSAAADVNMLATIHMDISTIGPNLRNSSALKWVVTEGDSTNVGPVLASDTFMGVNSGDSIILLSDITVTTTATQYTIWIWIDANESPDPLISGESLDTNVWVEINQLEGAAKVFEISRMANDSQNITATVLSNNGNITHYALTTTNEEPSDWELIPLNQQSNIYNFSYNAPDTGTYYVWFKNAGGEVISRVIEITSFDETSPTCTFGNFSQDVIGVNGTATIELTCTDTETRLTDNTLSASDFSLSNDSAISITNVQRQPITNGYTYTLTVSGLTDNQSSTITLPTNKIANSVGLKNASTLSTSIMVSNDQEAPIFDLGISSGTTYAKQKTASITISDNKALTPGTYTFKYDWSVDELTCADLTRTTSITVGNGESYKSTSVTIDSETGAGKLYVCNNSAITDLSGNSVPANTLIDRYMYLDNTPPTFDISVYFRQGYDGRPIYSQISALISNASDSGQSGVYGSYYYKLTQDSTCDETTTGFVTDIYHPYTFTSGITDLGTWYVCAWIQDRVGNKAYNSGSIEIEAYLRTLPGSSVNGNPAYFKETDYNSKITKVAIANNIDLTNAVQNKDPYILDVYNAGIIKGWLELNDVTNNTYDLYIGANTNVIYATNLHRLFISMNNLSNISLQGLNTIFVTDMIETFTSTGRNASNFSLDLGNDFHTGNVKNMVRMFENLGENARNFNINIGNNFDTSNVTNMYNMFYHAGYRANEFNLNLGNNFDIGNVTNTTGMFNATGWGSNSFSLNLGNNFNASRLTSLRWFFYGVGGLANDFDLDLGNNFNLSNVTSLDSVFSGLGGNAENFSLDLGNNFNTSNVTNMHNMFRGMGSYESTNFSLNLGNNFDTSNVTNMANMFIGVGRNDSNFSLNLGNKFNTINVTNMSWMFYLALAGNSNIDFGDNFDTSNVIDMSYMFDTFGRYDNEISFNLDSKFNTINVVDMSHMFSRIGWDSLGNISLNLSGLDTSNVTNMADMFYQIGTYGTNSTQGFYLDLGNEFNTINVTSMHNMFSTITPGVNNFSIDLGNNFDTSNVTNMSGMFYFAGNSAHNFSLNLGNKFNTSNVTDMSSMFANAARVADDFSLDLGDKFNTSQVNSMYQMFYNTGVSSSNFSLNLGNNFDTSNVTTMGNMFCNTGSKSSNFVLDLGDKFNTSKVVYMYNMFYRAGYNSTTFYLDLGNQFNTISATGSMYGMFFGTGTNAVDFSLDLGDDFYTRNINNMYGMFQDLGYSARNFSLRLGNNFDTSNVTNMTNMFAGVGSKAINFSLDLGNGLNTVNVTSMYGMFNSVGTYATIFNLNLGSDFNTSKVTTMGYMFYNVGHSAAEFNLDLGNNFDTRSVKNMSLMFSNVGSSAASFNLDLGSKFNTSNVNAMPSMFQQVGSSAIDFNLNLGDDFDTGKVISMYGMFNGVGQNAKNFSLNLGNKFDTSNVTSIYNMFQDVGANSSNFELNLGDNFNTSKIANMYGMFQNAGKNAANFSLYLGNSFNTSNVTAAVNMFRNVGNKAQAPFVLNLTTANFSKVTTAGYANMFVDFSNRSGTIYVNNKITQDWVIARNSANFNANNVLTYNVNYYLDGGQFEDDVEYFVKGRTTAYEVPRPVKAGYTFAGWTGANGNTPELDLVIPVGTNDIVKYYANWDALSYSITYNLDGGSLADAKNTYTPSETFNLNIPYKQGYIFTGWTGSNGETEQFTVTIPKNTIGDLSYTAHYRLTTNDAEDSLALLHKLGGTAMISTTTGTTNGTCPAVDNSGNMTIKSIDNSSGRLCQALDNYGASLVFRGNVTNNYVKLGTITASGKDIYWRIVRINGDGSLRLIYDGTTPHTNGEQSTDRALGQSKFSAVNTDNAYLGYMYGNLEYVSTPSGTYTQAAGTTYYYSPSPPEWKPANGYYMLSASDRVGLKGSDLTTNHIGWYTFKSGSATGTATTFYKVTNISGTTVTYEIYSRRSDTKEQAQTNVTDSTMKYFLDDWYTTKTNLSSLSSIMSDAIFCNDRTISSYAGTNNKGYGTNQTYYRWYYGPYSTNVNYPNLICSVQNDSFTVSDTTNGNGDLTYPIGILTQDEAAAAGAYNANNTGYYLYTGYIWPTMTPSHYQNIKCVNASGQIGANLGVAAGGYVRPVINIDSSSLLSGNGSKEMPFVSTVIADTTYFIKYTLNGGTQSSPVTSYTSSTATFTLENPTRAGYTFAGWTGANGTTPELTVSVTTGTYGNLYYTANWTPNDYTVTLSSVSATDHGTTSVTATYAGAMPDIIIPTKDDYAFVGYYTDLDGAGTQYYTYQGRSAATYAIADDATLYAYFISSVITLDNQGATVSGDTSVTANYGEYLPAITTPEKDGTYFMGYYSEVSCAGTKYINNNGNGVTAWTATSPTTLYACYTIPQKAKDIWTNDTYLYSGASADVNNYITFNNAEAGYRIIGLFDNRLKIIKVSSTGDRYWHSYNTNTWSASTLKTYLNVDFYGSLNIEARSMISPYDFKVGSCAATVTATLAKQCIATATYSSFVGVQDVADYAMSSSGCNNDSYPVSSYNTNACKNTSWLLQNEWTINAVINVTNNALRKNSNNVVSTAPKTNSGVRPVVYLNEDVYILGGTGTKTDPYTLILIDEE